MAHYQSSFLCDAGEAVAACLIRPSEHHRRKAVARVRRLVVAPDPPSLHRQLPGRSSRSVGSHLPGAASYSHCRPCVAGRHCPLYCHLIYRVIEPMIDLERSALIGDFESLGLWSVVNKRTRYIPRRAVKPGARVMNIGITTIGPIDKTRHRLQQRLA
jgi:hypothetical protein